MASIVQLDPDSAELKKRIERFQSVRDNILAQVRQVIVGQEEVLDQILISLFVGGHCLITGLPGTAKTLMVRTIAQTLGLMFKRIQFTPDLMPSDITGTDIIEEDPTTGHRKWTFVHGPIFGNVLLADEINRTPPKTQSALLEAMQERSCTVRGHVYALPAPFFVLATQNPIELEGTYPLPEAQLDRFLFKLLVPFPGPEDLGEIARRTTGATEAELLPVATGDDLSAMSLLAREVPVAEPVMERAVLSLLGRLDLAYRRPRSGLYAGERRSPRSARSPEFSDFRAYVAGDDYRQIDWGAYARLEKLVLRLYVAEEEACLNLVLDASASM